MHRSRVRGLAVSALVTESDINAALWALVALEELSAFLATGCGKG